MKTASAETRALVVKTYTSGVASRKQLAEIFGYHMQRIGNWIRAFEREEQIAPHAQGHRKSVFSDEEKAGLADLFRSDVDVPLEEIREMFSKTCTLSAIHRTVGKLGFVFKKKRCGQASWKAKISSKAAMHGRNFNVRQNLPVWYFWMSQA